MVRKMIYNKKPTHKREREFYKPKDHTRATYLRWRIKVVNKKGESLEHTWKRVADRQLITWAQNLKPLGDILTTKK